MDELIEKEFKKLVEKDAEVAWKSMLLSVFQMMKLTKEEPRKICEECKYHDHEIKQGSPCRSCKRMYPDFYEESK